MAASTRRRKSLRIFCPQRVDNCMSSQEDGDAKNSALVPHRPLNWYWWFRGKFLSPVPSNYLPTSNDVLEQLAWASIKYDHLGGPNTQHVVCKKIKTLICQLLTHVKPGIVTNPNGAWDITATKTMRQVFQFENLLHFITVMLHMVVLFPLTTSFLLTQGGKRRWIRFIVERYEQMRKK